MPYTKTNFNIHPATSLSNPKNLSLNSFFFSISKITSILATSLSFFHISPPHEKKLAFLGAAVYRSTNEGRGTRKQPAKRSVLFQCKSHAPRQLVLFRFFLVHCRSSHPTGPGVKGAHASWHPLSSFSETQVCGTRDSRQEWAQVAQEDPAQGA